MNIVGVGRVKLDYFKMCFHSESYKGSRGITYSFGEMSCIPLWERNCKCQVISLCNQLTGAQEDSHGRRLKLSSLCASLTCGYLDQSSLVQRSKQMERKSPLEMRKDVFREPGDTTEVGSPPKREGKEGLAGAALTSPAQPPGASVHWMLRDVHASHLEMLKMRFWI